METRAERPGDYSEIYDVIFKAFQQYKQPQIVESTKNLVERVRLSGDYIPELSLVAVNYEKIVGHIMLSYIVIQKKDGELRVLSLAPVSVLPEYQNQGIGSQLIECGISEAKRMGHKAIIVVGNPKYYPRFGFVSASKKNLQASFEIPDEAFMVLELLPGFLDNVRGIVKFPPEFHI